MSMKIYPIDHDEVYGRFRRELVKERVAIKKQDPKTHYACVMNGIHPVAVVGWQEIKEGHIRFKTDYVRMNFRGKGLYSALWDYRINLIFKEYDVHTISAYCTEMSLPKYLKENFLERGVNRNGITYVKYNP